MAHRGIEAVWEPPHRDDNRQFLRTRYPELFRLIGDLDAFGHRLAHRAPDLMGRIESVDGLVGLAFLRRLSTLFAGGRNLFENAAVESAKIVVRAHFELFLYVQLLVYGAKRPITPELTTSHRAREPRARYYYVAGLRERVYRAKALLDGKWGGRRPTGEAEAQLRREIDRDRRRLEKRFPAQLARMGPLRCFNADPGRRGYYDRQPWYYYCFRRSSNVVSARSLAERLGHTKDYYLCYSLLSGLVHPVGIHHDLDPAEDGMRLFSPYMVEAFELLAFWLCTFYAQSALYLTRAYMPEVQDDASRVVAQTNRAFADMEAVVPPGYAG